jgi:RHS repeat-associated protein
LAEQWSGPVAGTVEWRYNNDFLRVARKINGGEETSLVYDADGMMTGTGAFAVTRDPDSGRPGAFVLGGAHGWWAYDASGNYNGSSVSALGNEVYAARYERDAGSRVVRRDEWLNGVGVTWEYGYDIRGRLVSAKRNGEDYATYTWDANDNRTGEQRSQGQVTAEFDAGDHLKSANGTSVPKSTVDAWGNLLSVELPDSRIDYVVDGLGRRIGRKVDGVLRQTWIYNDSLRPAAELNAQGEVVSEFLYAGAAGPPAAMKRGGKHYVLVADQVGSVRMVIDSESGETVQQMDYDPFGRVLGDSNPGFQPFGFAGGIQDPATGLVRMGARDYAPSLGRWITADPRPFTGGSNHYAYCGGDPVNLWDPLGTDPTSRVGQVVQTVDSRSIGDAAGAVQKTIDVSGKAIEFAKDPKGVLEAEATKAATPEGARAEYERILEDLAKRAEESSANLKKQLDELYEKARKALCGDDGTTQPPDPGKSKGPNPRQVTVQPSKPSFVHPIYGPAAGARR